MGAPSARVFVAAAAAVWCLASGIQLAADGRAALSGGVTSHTVQPGDTLSTIGSRAGVDPQTLAAENRLGRTARLHPGDVLRIDNRHIVPADLLPGTIIVNVPQRMLFFDDGRGGLIAVPVAVGRASWRTPLGPFHIVKTETNPSWEVPASIQAEARRAGHSLPAVVPPGPENPLGKYWLGLSLGDVGIHGTNAPSSIYRVTTHGCIRVHPDDIAALFPHVALGTAGRVIYEPVLLAVAGGRVFVEAHRDVYGLAPDAAGDVRRLAEAAGATEQVDWAALDVVLAERAGVARDVTRIIPQSGESLPH